MRRSQLSSGRSHRTLLDRLEPRTLFAFGYTSVGGQYVVDTGAQVVFSVSQTNGDMTSIKYNGRELASPFSVSNRYSHYESGLSSTSTITIQENAPAGWIEIAVTDAGLGVTQYYIARKGHNDIDMATYDGNATPPTPGEMRYILYLDRSVFTNFNPAADINNKDVIEGKDTFENLTTGISGSKFYSPTDNIDDPYHGVTGSGVGAFMWIGNREKGSGGPFFKDIQQQNDSSDELYNYMYSGHTQTDNYRAGLQGPYTLEITDGRQPLPGDYSFLSGLNLLGYVGASGRGTVQGTVSGVPSGFPVVVGLSGPQGQYWVKVQDGSSAYSIPNVIQGTYTATLYKDELAVATQQVTLAGKIQTVNLASQEQAVKAVWAIGQWDGTPAGFINADKLGTEHPSDSRMASWTPGVFNVNTAKASAFPSVEFKGVNDAQKILFTLSPSQVKAYTLRLGITISQFGARPQITLNPGQKFAWNSPSPPGPNEPNSRGLTRGTFRGNYVLYTYNIPATALHAGQNIIQINVISGQNGSDPWLTPAYAFDALDLSPTPAGSFGPPLTVTTSAVAHYIPITDSVASDLSVTGAAVLRDLTSGNDAVDALVMPVA